MHLGLRSRRSGRNCPERHRATPIRGRTGASSSTGASEETRTLDLSITNRRVYASLKTPFALAVLFSAELTVIAGRCTFAASYIGRFGKELP